MNMKNTEIRMLFMNQNIPTCSKTLLSGVFPGLNCRFSAVSQSGLNTMKSAENSAFLKATFSLLRQIEEIYLFTIDN